MSVLQTVDRALELVRLVASRGEMSVTEVAGALEISPSMAHRLLGTCTKKGFLRQDVNGGPYSVGPVLRQVAEDVERDTGLKKLLAPLLRRIAKELSETCSVAVLEGRNIRFLLSEEGPHLVKISHPIRRVASAQTTAAGRALLSALSDVDVETRFRGMKWESDETQSQEPVRGVHSLDQLLKEVQRTRLRGWAVQAGESQMGLAAVAMPLLDRTGAGVAAVTVTVPYLRLHRASDAVALAERLQPHVEQMQRRLLG